MRERRLRRKERGRRDRGPIISSSFRLGHSGFVVRVSHSGRKRSRALQRRKTDISYHVPEVRRYRNWWHNTELILFETSARHGGTVGSTFSFTRLFEVVRCFQIPHANPFISHQAYWSLLRDCRGRRRRNHKAWCIPTRGS